MWPALNTAALAERDPAAQVALAAAAGFAGIEFTAATDGPLTPATPAASLRELSRIVTDAGLIAVGLATGLWFQTNYAAPAEAARARAYDLTRQLMDQAAALRPGAPAGRPSVLVIPAIVGRATDARPTVAYRDALNRAYDALQALAVEAEDRGVVLAVETAWNRFLLSPVEAADFCDRLNSPNVGMYVDVGNLLAYGYPEDWIRTLGRHVARVHAKDYDVHQPGRAGFCDLGAGSVAWPEVLTALRTIGYAGPLTYEGPGEPVAVARRLRNIIAGRPPLETGPPA